MRVAGILFIFSTAWAAEPAREAAAKAIAMLETSQKSWKQNCVSCHHQLLPPLAFRVAREHGIPVNEELAHASSVRAFGFLTDLDRAVQYTHVIDPAISDGYTVLGA